METKSLQIVFSFILWKLDICAWRVGDAVNQSCMQWEIREIVEGEERESKRRGWFPQLSSLCELVIFADV